jgi:hypothetical protein
MAVRIVRSHGGLVGFDRPSTDLPVLADEDDDPVMKLTTECITTPFDKALVQCVLSSNQVGACFESFEDRRGSTSGLKPHRVR